MTPRQSGFSLIELLIVLSILAIILTMVIPSFLPVYEHYDTEQALLLVEQDLRSAQQRALGEGVRIEVHFSVGSSSYRVVHEQGQILQERELPVGMSITSNFSHDQLHFNRNGRIHRAGRVMFYYEKRKRKHQKEFVFQLGSGRFYTNP